jgi:uncharacterized membrane protein (DUF106 family)
MIAEFVQSYPRTSIILLGLIISLFISLVNYFVLDKEKMRNLKERQKAIQKEMKDHKDNPQKLMELQKEMLSQAGETMKHTLKPMLITFIPVLLIFGFMRGLFAPTEVAKTWFWWYIGSSFAGSILFRKLLKLP